MGILETLVEKKIIGADDISAEKKEVRAAGGNVEEALLKRGISPQDILNAKGDSLGIPTRVIENQDVPFELLKYVPEESALHYKFVPIGLHEGVLEVGVVDPDNIEARDALNFISSKINLPFKIFLISEADFEKILQVYKGLSGEVTKALSELETELSAEESEIAAETKVAEPDVSGGTKIIEDAPVTKIVATILHYASEGSASDIHIEHTGEKIRVRFRVDGVLHTSLILPVKVHSAVVAGMRILDSERGVKSIDQMGFSKRNLELIKKAIKAPYGMILISGPTGSCKSTTLYSMLNEVDKEGANVLSLEDPVED